MNNKQSSFLLSESNTKVIKFSEKNDKRLIAELLRYFQENYAMSPAFYHHQALDHLLNYKMKSSILSIFFLLFFFIFYYLLYYEYIYVYKYINTIIIYYYNVFYYL